jgi:hypothetical protein
VTEERDDKQERFHLPTVKELEAAITHASHFHGIDLGFNANRMACQVYEHLSKLPSATGDTTGFLGAAGDLRFMAKGEINSAFKERLLEIAELLSRSATDSGKVQP